MQSFGRASCRSKASCGALVELRAELNAKLRAELHAEPCVGVQTCRCTDVQTFVQAINCRDVCRDDCMGN